MSAQMPEYPMLRHYLELIAELPWSTSSQEGFVYPDPDLILKLVGSGIII
jgi:hypothetical protein